MANSVAMAARGGIIARSAGGRGGAWRRRYGIKRRVRCGASALARFAARIALSCVAVRAAAAA